MSRRNSATVIPGPSRRPSTASTISSRSTRSTRSSWRAPERPPFPPESANGPTVSTYFKGLLLSEQSTLNDPFINSEIEALERRRLPINGLVLRQWSEARLTGHLSPFLAALVIAERSVHIRPDETSPDATASARDGAWFPDWPLAVFAMGIAACNVAASFIEGKDGHAKSAGLVIALAVALITMVKLTRLGDWLSRTTSDWLART